MAIDKTAFGIDKVSQDFSQVHALFTFDLPDKLLRVAERVNGVITFHSTNDTAVYASSVNGELVCQSGPNMGDVTFVYTRRHPRLQPNRGLIFSPSAFVDTFNVPGAEIEYGLLNFDETTMLIRDGVTVLYKEGKMYARIYSLGVLKYNERIDPARISRLDGLFDPSRGHLFDIQGQWRGVGNFEFHLSSPYDAQPWSVHTYPALNYSNNLTISSPAMHACFIARNAGGAARVRSGCFDVSSEGGIDEQQTFFYANNDADVTVTAEKIMLVLRLPFTFKDRLNTRDVQFYQITARSDKKGSIKVWVTRDGSVMTKGAGAQLVDTDWTNVPDGSSMQYIDNSSNLITGFNKTGLKSFLRIPLEANVIFRYPMPSPERIPVWFTHGDYIIVEGYGATAAMFASLDLGELI